VLLPNDLRELNVFGAEAQQLFCESFHVTVKFKRERRKTVGFPALAGLPSALDAFFRRAVSWGSSAVVVLTGDHPSDLVVNSVRPRVESASRDRPRLSVADLNCRVPGERIEQHSVACCNENGNPSPSDGLR